MLMCSFFFFPPPCILPSPGLAWLCLTLKAGAKPGASQVLQLARASRGEARAEILLFPTLQ